MRRILVRCLCVACLIVIACAALPSPAYSKPVCEQSQEKCTATETKCTQTKQECARTTKKCVAHTTQCLQKNSKGQCVASQQVCTEYQESCAQYREVCAKREQVCVKSEKVCVKWRDASSGKMSCRSCEAHRKACYAPCDKMQDLVMGNRCVNQCNAKYSCVIGHDCE